MKKVININFQGRVTPIEETAFELLNRYIESLRKYFANEEGRDEIINDIEGRIAELFGETLKKGSTCITEDDVNRIIDSMGRPEDFEAEENNVHAQLNAQEQRQQYNFDGNTAAKKLYRDENNKVLGGVCSGLANYFNIDPVVARVLFVIFFGVTFLPYIILWVAIPSSATKVIGSQRKRLFRDPDDKIIAGVCSGLSSYFGVNVWIPRLLFLIPFFSFVFRFSNVGIWHFPHFLKFSFSPGALFIYTILWMILPEAKTSAEKLEMKGEKVDLNNIKNTIQNDMMAFAKKAEKFGEELGTKGKEMGETVAEKTKQFGTEATTVVKKKSGGLGDAIAMIAKIFAYFILGTVTLSIVIALFGAGIALTGLMPLKNYILNEGLQNWCAWGTLLFFVWVPVIGTIVFIVRRIAKLKGNSNLIRYSFTALWILGWFCMINLLVSIRNEFKAKNEAYEENIVLQNAGINKLEVKAASFGKYYRSDWLRLEPFASFDEDTAIIRNISIRIVKSKTDSFSVKMVKFSQGSSRKQANYLASKMDYTIVQEDSLLLLDKGIKINEQDKFRNQYIDVTIAVPVGKKIIIRKNSGWSWGRYERVQFGNDNYWGYDWNYEEGTERWKHDVEYIMTKDGLKRTSSFTDDEDDWEDDSNDYNKKLKKYQRSREELQREYEETKRKADELKEQLQTAPDTLQQPKQPKKETSPKNNSSTKNVSTAAAQTKSLLNNNLQMRLSI